MGVPFKVFRVSLIRRGVMGGEDTVLDRFVCCAPNEETLRADLSVIDVARWNDLRVLDLQSVNSTDARLDRIGLCRDLQIAAEAAISEREGFERDQALAEIRRGILGYPFPLPGS